MKCKNRHAYEHIGVVQDFVDSHVRKDVDAERERHSRGYATFDMLWLLYKPGADVYTDIYDVGEHEPCVLESLFFSLVNGVTDSYEAQWWKLCSDEGWVGPHISKRFINRFAGEKEIVSLVSFPCEYLSLFGEVGVGDAEKIRQHFVDRGKKWYEIQGSKQCYHFDGVTTTSPRSAVSSRSAILKR